MSKKRLNRYCANPDKAPLSTDKGDSRPYSLISPIRQKLDRLFDQALSGVALEMLSENTLDDAGLALEWQEQEQGYKLLIDVCTLDVKYLHLRVDSGHLGLLYVPDETAQSSYSTAPFQQEVGLPAETDQETISAVIEGMKLILSINKQTVIPDASVKVIEIQTS